MGIVIAILIFLVLIVSHELGHFLVARANGVRVTEFAIGLGPKICGHKGKETELTWRALPIGGACIMVGEDEDSDDPKAFNKKTVPQRIAVIAGGPVMNFVLAIVIFIVLFAGMGVATGSNVIGGVIADQPAQVAGIEAGDQVLAINGVETPDWTTLISVMQEQTTGNAVTLTILRDGSKQTIAVQRYYDQTQKRYLVGVEPETKTMGIFQAIGMGFKQCFEMTKLLLVTLFQMLTGQMAADISGPVGVVSLIGQTAATGVQNVLILTAFLSINLGVINLLPIPALDGSRIVFLIVEGIRRKPVQREGLIHFIGFMALIGLIIVVTYNDVVRLITGG